MHGVRCYLQNKYDKLNTTLRPNKSDKRSLFSIKLSNHKYHISQVQICNNANNMGTGGHITIAALLVAH